MKQLFSEKTSERILKGTVLLSVLGVLVIGVWAFNVTWNAPVSLVVDSVDLKVYAEADCTTPINSIDFGLAQVITTYTVNLYVRNEGLGPVVVRWNSTLSQVTNRITDNWQFFTGSWFPLNGTTISHDQVLQTRYQIVLQQAVVPGSYSWTLYLGATQTP